jgi:four helix bundle protein
LSSSIVRDKSFAFAVRTVEICKLLQNEQKEYILSKQLLRSGTSIGANVRESLNAESKKDFVHKLLIAQKECDEVIYRLDLLYKTNYLTGEDYHELNNSAKSLLKIIKSIILTTKERYLRNP